MYETRRQYRKLVENEVLALEWMLGRPVRQGRAGFCPRCLETGNFDLYSVGFTPGAGNSIYYSTVFNEWRCRLCDYRMCA